MLFVERIGNSQYSWEITLLYESVISLPSIYSKTFS